MYRSPNHHRASPLWLAGVLGLLLAGPEILQAGSWVNLGVLDSISVDQPRVLFEIRDVNNPSLVIGPPLLNEGILDTGANAIVLGVDAYTTMSDPFDPSTRVVDPNLYQVFTHSDGSKVQVPVVGASGMTYVDMLVAYNFAYAPANQPEHNIPSAYLLGSSAENMTLGGWAAVVGMPAMMGKVTNLNLRNMIITDIFNFDQGMIATTITNQRPTPTATTYEVALRMLPPDLSPDPNFPLDPIPTAAPVPLIDGIKLANATAPVQTGSFLFDTGAQATIISTAMALASNAQPVIDPETGEPVFLPGTGLNGEPVDIPLVTIKRLSIPTTSGTDLVFTNVEAGAADIAGFDGILGSNFLTTAYFDLIFDFGTTLYGTFGAATLDFSDPAGQTGYLVLDVNPDHHDLHITSPVFPGDLNGDDVVNNQDIAAFVLALTDAAAWQSAYPDINLLEAGDINGDAVFNNQDIASFVALLTGSGTSLSDLNALNSIPEPASLALLAAGGVWLLSRRRTSAC